MDEPIRLRTPQDPQVCDWCGTPLGEVTGQCSACGRSAGQPDTVSERPTEEIAA